MRRPGAGRSRSTGSRAQAPRHRTQTHRDDGTHSRRSCGAHDVWARLALYYAENERNKERLTRAREAISYGKISGAVGTFAHLDPEVEERVCEKLALKTRADLDSDHSARPPRRVLSTLAIIASSMEKIALEVRHLQRTEVREAEEPFSAGQKGSSAMPHKRNPVTSEQICGLARVVRANSQAALENIALWHERDISHSSVERVILPDSCILADYLINKTEWLIDGLLCIRAHALQPGIAGGSDCERTIAVGVDAQGSVARGRLRDCAAAGDARLG